MFVTDFSMLGQRCENKYLQSSVAVMIFNPLSLVCSAMYHSFTPSCQNALPSKHMLYLSNTGILWVLRMVKCTNSTKQNSYFMNSYLIRKVAVMEETQRGTTDFPGKCVLKQRGEILKRCVPAGVKVLI